jgi:hypothetical protein
VSCSTRGRLRNSKTSPDPAGPLFPTRKSRGLVRLALFRYGRCWVGHGRRTLRGKDFLHETTRVEGPAACERRGLLGPRSRESLATLGGHESVTGDGPCAAPPLPFALRVGPRGTRSILPLTWPSVDAIGFRLAFWSQRPGVGTFLQRGEGGSAPADANAVLPIGESGGLRRVLVFVGRQDRGLPRSPTSTQSR